MSKKPKPNGFVATCRCGCVVGAIDINRTDQKEAGKILGKWLYDGCSVDPRFKDSWSVSVTSCKC